MADRRPAAPGAAHAPDVADAELSDWAAERLRDGFVIEEARLGAAVDWGGEEAAHGRITRSRLERVALSGVRLRCLELVDVIAHNLEAANAVWTGARLERVAIEGCRMTGLDAAELDAVDVVFRDCKLDLANFRHARIRRVTFEGCMLDEADFAGARIQSSRFSRSRLRRTRVDNLSLSRVDLRGSELEPHGDVHALAGAIIDSGQLVDLSRRLADGIGIVVDDG